MEKTYNYVYQITNNVNNKIYVGVHKTNNMDDGYMGSGTLLKRAYMKYGKSAFTKTILKHFSTYNEALLYEAEVVDEDFMRRTDTYNIRTGGISNAMFNEETKDKIRQSQIKVWSSPEYKDKMIAIFNSESRIEKMSKGIKTWINDNPEKHMERMLKINKNPEKIAKMAAKQTGRPQTEERKKNISKSLIGKALGEDNGNFIGYYITPMGKFPSLGIASKATRNAPICIRDRCRIKNTNTVKAESVRTDKKITTEMLGKTWKELGWGFEEVIKEDANEQA